MDNNIDVFSHRCITKLIYLLFIFLLRLTYNQTKITSFSTDKHKKMVKLSKLAIKVFDLLVMVIGKKQSIAIQCLLTMKDVRS
jgi:hypothetical protein